MDRRPPFLGTAPGPAYAAALLTVVVVSAVRGDWGPLVHGLLWGAAVGVPTARMATGPRRALRLNRDPARPSADVLDQ